jgi:hypothetical protein
MAGRRSPPSQSISRLTLPPDTIPSCYRRSRHTEFQPLSGRHRVASGDVEIGFNQISEVLAQPTVEFAGPLPSAIQNYTQFAPGIVADSNQTDAARALVTFLTSPAAQTVLKAKGFE